MEAVPGGADYWDLGLLEGHVHLKYTAVNEDGRVLTDEWVNLPIPEDTMGELEKLVGDGQATITIGKELKVSEDYKTAASTAWVKLTCNQDLESIMAIREIATQLALGFVQHGYELARHTLDKMYGKDTQYPEPLVIEEASEDTIEKSPRQSKAKEEDPEPLRRQGSPKPTLSGKNRPSFRR